ncbi:hypothetical protein [Algoriphagus sp. A40]|uniref:DUF6922 domain-containing protein n=1 Tax=Algoriphagus sp. A40 TaxID=1945863 RepID=UPI0009878336|nr:hypothetical protein [Algoriphagus sp. A40]OOG72283.1 hypothetical protein B0E43_15375 [Algoriphagus sp. A40]
MNSAIKIPNKKNSILLSEYFPREIFWDVNLDELDYKKDSDFVIPRVLDWGNFKNSWSNLKKLYPENVIQYYCLNQSQIFGNENIELLGKLFNINPDEFPRYVK